MARNFARATNEWGTLAKVSAALVLSMCWGCVELPGDGYGNLPIVSPWDIVPDSSERPVRQFSVIPSKGIEFETNEGTFMNVDVSPVGTELTFDLLGDLYLLPIEGGDAIPLTFGRAWDQAPRFSPGGEFVYFVSDRKGAKNIWRFSLSDQSLQQITTSGSDIVGTPNWSQDGDHLLVGRADVDTGGYSEFILQSIDPSTGNMTAINPPIGPWIDMDTFESRRASISIFSGAESVDGEVYFSEAQFDPKKGSTTARIYRFDTNAKTRITLTQPDGSYSDYKPQLSHDGNLLAYFRQYNDRRTEVRILDITTGQDDALIVLADADDASYSASQALRPNYAFTPDDAHLVFWHAGKIHRVNLSTGSIEVIPFRVTVEREVWIRAQSTVQRVRENGEAKVVRWPSFSRDGQTMAFAAIGYVWIMDLVTGDIRRLTDSTDFEYMSAISPDGRSVAYISFGHTGNDYGSGRLMVVAVDGGTPRELLAASNTTYLLPNWSQDGSMIALIREVESENGVQAEFGWSPAATGRFHTVALSPSSNDRSSFYIYARFVGFDETGQKLLFSYPRSKHEVALVMADLDGKNRKPLAIGGADIGGITPAPDLKNLALTRRDGTVWVAPFNRSEEQIKVSLLLRGTSPVSDRGGYYVEWSAPAQITYGFGKNIYRYLLDQRALEVRPAEISILKPDAAQVVAFTGARLITMSGNEGAGPVIESGTLMLSGPRIIAVGPINEVDIPSGALVVDATGKTIMPGLLDAHYHRIGGDNLSALALPGDRFSDHSAIAYGITAAWEPGASPNDGVPATVDLQRAGRIVGPRWSHSAMGSIGYPWDLLTTYSAALAAVDQHRELGVIVLKEYLTPNREQRQWLSAAAHERGLGIVSHLESFDGMMTRIVDGYTGGDHPHIPVPFYKDVRELLRQTGYIWTPNIIITSGTVGTGQDKDNYFCIALLEWSSQLEFGAKTFASICNSDQEEPTVPYEIHRVGRVAKQSATAAQNGIHIGVSAHNMPASNLHREMWYLWKGGLAVAEVLRATTIGNAEKLGLQAEIGSLEVGKMADFLVLDENPLDDILNTLSLKYTVQGGIIYDSATAERTELTNSMPEADTAVVH